jgi:hypothetical protein
VIRRASRGGFSLVELIIALTLLVLVLGLPAMILRSSSMAYSTGTSTGEIDLSSRRSLDLLASRLVSSALGRIPAAAAGPDVPHTAVTFQVATGFDGDATVWAPDERIALEPEPGEAVDGADNDGDGLVDEHRIVLIRDLGLATERTTVVCRRVARSLEGELPGNGLDDNGNGFVDEGGLLIAFDGERVLLALTLERRDAFRAPIVSTAQRTIALRN